MKKNVASQVVGAQMISASDGSAFSGSVTVYVTGDAGTQAVGSVSSGACTSEGNGFYTYAPAQAETNYDHVAFTFIGTGAIPTTVQVYTNFPQTGDSFARVGAPVGASISADVAAVKTQTAAIEVDTADIQSRIPAALVSGRIDASVGAMAANVLTATAINADAITAAKVAADVGTEIGTACWATTTRVLTAGTNIVLAKGVGVTGFNDPSTADIADGVWDESISGHLTGGSTGAALNAAGSAGDPWTTPLPGAYSSGTAGYIIGTNLDTPVSTVSGGLDAAGVRAAIGLASANLDAQLDALPTAAENTSAVWAAGTRTLTAIDEDTTTLDLDATIRGALGMAAADLDTQIDTLATASALATAAGYIDTEVAAIKAKTDNLPASPAATGDIPSVDAIWDEAVDGTVTARQSMRLHNSALAGKASGLETTSVAFRDLADTKDRITATVTADGNRTAVTTDLT